MKLHPEWRSILWRAWSMRLTYVLATIVILIDPLLAILVDLSAGPLDRALGLSTVQLHTAAATTDASIPGLRTADAAQLRDRLAAAGAQRSAGL